jgi:hypothetical protein
MVVTVVPIVNSDLDVAVTERTGATWKNSTGVIVDITGNTTRCRGTTGIGATVIQTMPK